MSLPPELRVYHEGRGKTGVQHAGRKEVLTIPRVSICIPAYNSAQHIREAIESVLCQSFTDFELLVIDDCSTDGTAEIARPYAARDGRIRFIANERNLGMVENWNRCLIEARCEYVKYIFSDDLFCSPHALERMVAVLDENPAVTLVSSARKIIDSEGRVMEILSHFENGTRARGVDIINFCMAGMLREHNVIGEPSSVMFRRCQGSRGFDPRYRQLVDLEMWFHLLEQGDFAYIDDPLCSFRRHDGQQTRVNVNSLRYMDDLGLLFDEYLDKGYIRLGFLTRRYHVYYQYYKLWKHARQGKHDRKLVSDKIRNGYGTGKFFLAMPLYKIVSPLFKLFNPYVGNKEIRKRFLRADGR